MAQAKTTNGLNRYFAWGTALLGIAFLAAGILMLVQGNHTRTEVVESLRAEKLEVGDPEILLSYEGARAPEGVEVPTVLIDTSMEAHYQALVIRTHTLNTTGGLTYSEMDREDPNRDFYLNSLTLQNSLHQAHVSLEVTRMVLGIGVAFAGLGLGILLIGLPTVRKVFS
jgi:hypothetical protein